uniref:Ig-like domain-containing protein n=1 Tax=Serinus canaria TaxID=9135 RepID=A0A8C9NR50_SERCA
MHFTSHLSSPFSPGWALQQSPDTLARVGDTVTLECSASGKTFVNMYWYKLPMEKNASLQLVVYSVEGGKADIEKEFKNRFQTLSLSTSWKDKAHWSLAPLVSKESAHCSAPGTTSYTTAL